MSAPAQTVRSSPVQHRTLAGFVGQRGLSEYTMLARLVDTRLTALVQGPGSSIDTHEIVTELAFVSTRIVDVERMLDRALFAASAAYCYACSVASGAQERRDPHRRDYRRLQSPARPRAGEPRLLSPADRPENRRQHPLHPHDRDKGRINGGRAEVMPSMSRPAPPPSELGEERSKRSISILPATGVLLMAMWIPASPPRRA